MDLTNLEVKDQDHDYLEREIKSIFSLFLQEALDLNPAELLYLSLDNNFWFLDFHFIKRLVDSADSKHGVFLRLNVAKSKEENINSGIGDGWTNKTLQAMQYAIKDSSVSFVIGENSVFPEDHTKTPCGTSCCIAKISESDTLFAQVSSVVVAKIFSVLHHGDPLNFFVYGDKSSPTQIPIDELALDIPEYLLSFLPTNILVFSSLTGASIQGDAEKAVGPLLMLLAFSRLAEIPLKSLAEKACEFLEKHESEWSWQIAITLAPNFTLLFQQQVDISRIGQLIIDASNETLVGRYGQDALSLLEKVITYVESNNEEGETILDWTNGVVKNRKFTVQQYPQPIEFSISFLMDFIVTTFEALSFSEIQIATKKLLLIITSYLSKRKDDGKDITSCLYFAVCEDEESLHKATYIGSKYDKDQPDLNQLISARQTRRFSECSSDRLKSYQEKRFREKIAFKIQYYVAKITNDSETDLHAYTILRFLEQFVITLYLKDLLNSAVIALVPRDSGPGLSLLDCSKGGLF